MIKRTIVNILGEPNGILDLKKKRFDKSVNPIQDEEGGGGDPPTSFSPINSKDVRLRCQNVLPFSFTPFATIV